MRRLNTFSTIMLLLIIGIYLYMDYRSHQTSSKTASISPAPSHLVLGTSVKSNPSAQCHAIQVNPNDPQAFLPDPNCTPGSTNQDVTQDTIHSTICVQGYTKTIRPPVTYTSTLKRQQITEYGYDDTNVRDYEEDHFISLELGGNPTDPKNLWPEPHPSLNEKDKVEDYLNRKVCSGEITLQEAQQEITKNWYEVFLNAHF